MQKPTVSVRTLKRSVVLAVFLLLVFAFLLVRIFAIQVFDFSKYQANIELFNNDISIVLKEFNFNIKDVENQSALKFNDFNLSFKDKKLSLNLSKILVEFDL